MSDEPIKRGDLVLLIKPLACGHGDMGLVSTVEKISMGGYGSCPKCGYLNEPEMIAHLSNGRIKNISRLKRIPPLGELEDTPTQERIEA